MLIDSKHHIPASTGGDTPPPVVKPDDITLTADPPKEAPAIGQAFTFSVSLDLKALIGPQAISRTSSVRKGKTRPRDVPDVSVAVYVLNVLPKGLEYLQPLPSGGICLGSAVAVLS